MARILGLDAASVKYGWAVLDTETNKVIAKGLMNFRDFKNEDFGKLLEALYNELKAIKTKYKVTDVAIEDTYCKNVKTMAKLVEVRAASRLAVMPLTLNMIHTKTLKSHMGMDKDKELKKTLKEIKENEKFTPSQKSSRSSKAKKDCVMRLVNKKYNLQIKVDDISDAVAVADTYASV